VAGEHGDDAGTARREVALVDHEPTLDEPLVGQPGVRCQRVQTGGGLEVAEQATDTGGVGQHHPRLVEAHLEVGVVTTVDAQAGPEDRSAPHP
jgi:hypothetical protein